MGPEVDSQRVRLIDSGDAQHLAVRRLVAEIVIDGPMCRTDLKITFANDLGRTVEGDLIFPLPPTAALCELCVKVGARSLRGKFRPRERAQAEYHRAVQAGKTAALGESEGEDLGRLRVAPIEPGEDVEVTLGVVHTLTPISLGHRLLLPLTYMPRYVEDPAGLKPTESAAVHRPRPLTLAARADIQIAIRKYGPAIAVRCATHTTELHEGPALLEVNVRGVPLDRDLHLEIVDRTSGDLPTVWVRHDPSPGPDAQGPTTAVALIPPAFAEEGVTIARSVILLVDRSGSMSGEPIAAAQRAVRGCLRALGPADKFNIIAFSDSLYALAPRPLAFNDSSLALADQFVSGIAATGGTEAAMALSAVLSDDLGAKSAGRAQFMHREAPAPDGKHRLRIVVMMTDGDVGSAENVLRSAKDQLIDTRLFVIGIGDSVNHAMLAQLATLGSGTYTPVSTHEDLEKALLKLKNAIDAPILTGVRVRLECAGEVTTPDRMEPAGALDLFAGQPLLLAFRGPLAKNTVLHIEAQSSDGEDRKLRIPLDVASDSSSVDAETASLLWALLRNRRLTYRFDPADDAALEALGTTFGLLNRRVALLGIHAEQRDTAVSDSVPVVLPLPRNLAHGMGAGAPAKLSQSLTQTGGGPSVSHALHAMQNIAYASPPSPAPMAPPMPARPMPAPSAAVTRAAIPHPPSAPGAPSQSPAAKAAKKSKGVLQRVASLFQQAEADDDEAPVAPAPEALPADLQSLPPPGTSFSAPPAAPVAASGGHRRFSDDEAGLRALLLEQRADGLFASDLATTVLCVAILVSRGHSARTGNFRAELRRTNTALQTRLSTATGDDKLLCALGLAFLRMPHGEPGPAELPAEFASLLKGQSLNDLHLLAAAVQKVIAKAPPTFWRAPLCQDLIATFFR